MAIVWKEVGKEPLITQNNFSAMAPSGLSISTKVELDNLESMGYVLSDIHVELTGITASYNSPIILQKNIQEYEVVISTNSDVRDISGIVYGIYI